MSNKIIIIAEAGVNHIGDINIAKKLIDVAEEAGADYVKFQTFKTENIVSDDAKKADYQIKNTKNPGTQFEMLKKLELDLSTHQELIKYTNNKSVKFLSTAFDVDSVELLYNLGIRIFKIPSGEITNSILLKKIAKLKAVKIIMSTGMSYMQEVKDTLNFLIQQGSKKEDITILHCNSEYPTPFKDVNLKAMLTIAQELNVNIGYSDHTLGIEVPIAAAALGATIIEKHFTLDRNMEGPDHRASLEPNELINMVKSIRNIESCIGSGTKEPSESEKKNIISARKSLYIKKQIKKGEALQEVKLTAKRPGDGISPMKLSYVINQTVNKDIEQGHKLTWNDLEK